MLLTISGLSGSGKSTAAKGLAKLLDTPTVDIGEIFRALAKKYGMDVVTFGTYAEKHPEIDRKLDASMIRRARHHRKLILQGRLAGWMAVRHHIPSVRIWIGASVRTRAHRVARRQNIPYRKALAEIQKRDRDNLIRYRQTYGLDLNDLSIYDITVQTDDFTPEQVVSSLAKTLSLWPKKRKIPLKRPPSPQRLRKRPLLKRKPLSPK